MNTVLPQKIQRLLVAFLGVLLTCTTSFAMDPTPVISYENAESCDCKVDPDFSYSFGIVDPCTVFFTDLSSTNYCTSIVERKWDFGDGTTTNVQNPSHTYAVDGTYEVCLTVVGSDGQQKCEQKICKKITISGCSPCPCKVDANFSANFGIVDPCTLFFSDFSTTNSCTSISEWKWDFGDGTTSSAQNPSHTFSMDGTYTVCLTVVADNGAQKCVDTFCKTVTISGCSPCPCKLKSDFNYIFGIVDPCTLFFSENAETNSCTNVTNYFWDFGDGTTSTSANPGHTFPGNGTYNVCLTIVGNNGTDRCVDTYCQQVTIAGCSCPCKLESDFNYVFGIVDPCTLFFSENGSTNSCTNITSYFWDFGDGTTSTAANPGHTFPGDGTYTVCLTVAGNNGLNRCADVYCEQVTISGCYSSSFKRENNPGGDVEGLIAEVYPNPFNEVVTISFNNPVEQAVDIRLMDASGKEVSILHQGSIASGTQEVSFTASDYQLAPGLYLIHLTAGDMQKQYKLIYQP